MFFTYRLTGQVTGYSEERPTSSDVLKVIELPVTEDQLEEIKKAKQVRIENEQLEIISFKEFEGHEDIADKIEKLKEKKLTTDEIQTILLHLLKKSQNC